MCRMSGMTSESSEAKEKPVTPEPTAEKAPERKGPEVFVKGGTPTMRSERYFEDRFQEAEKRRDDLDMHRKAANVPVERGGAKLLSSQLTANPEVPRAYVLLKFCTPGGMETGLECLSDIIIGADPKSPTSLVMMLVCPGCMSQGQKHMQDCQLRIPQSQKDWQLVVGKGDPQFVFDDECYRSAGMITYCEHFRCVDCGWGARIDNNRVIQDR